MKETFDIVLKGQGARDDLETICRNTLFSLAELESYLHDLKDNVVPITELCEEVPTIRKDFKAFVDSFTLILNNLDMGSAVSTDTATRITV